MGFSTQVLKPNPLWSACSTSPYTIILSPLAYHIYRSSNEQDTNYDCHRTLPPTPNSSQVNMLILCQSLVTYSALSVAFESYSFHITQPLTCSPFLRPVFLGLWPEPFYLRKVNFCCSHWRWGVKSKWLPSHLWRWIRDPSSLSARLLYLNFIPCLSLIRLSKW